MKVRDLVAQLLTQDQDADVVLHVGWVDDTAVSDPQCNLVVRTSMFNQADNTNNVIISGWMSNTSGDLRHGLTDEEDV